jgi:hypothetical protein
MVPTTTPDPDNLPTPLSAFRASARRSSDTFRAVYEPDEHAQLAAAAEDTERETAAHPPVGALGALTLTSTERAIVLVALDEFHARHRSEHPTWGTLAAGIIDRMLEAGR